MIIIILGILAVGVGIVVGHDTIALLITLAAIAILGGIIVGILWRMQ